LILKDATEPLNDYSKKKKKTLITHI
jgi:hypothetical protein